MSLSFAHIDGFTETKKHIESGKFGTASQWKQIYRPCGDHRRWFSTESAQAAPVKQMMAWSMNWLFMRLGILFFVSWPEVLQNTYNLVEKCNNFLGIFFLYFSWLYLPPIERKKRFHFIQGSEHTLIAHYSPVQFQQVW